MKPSRIRWSAFTLSIFFESAGYHLHIHLIPRYASIEVRLQAWNMPIATKSPTFPDRYRRSYPAYNDDVDQLMSFLRDRLGPSAAA